MLFHIQHLPSMQQLKTYLTALFLLALTTCDQPPERSDMTETKTSEQSPGGRLPTWEQLLQPFHRQLTINVENFITKNGLRQVPIAMYVETQDDHAAALRKVLDSIPVHPPVVVEVLSTREDAVAIKASCGCGSATYSAPYLDALDHGSVYQVVESLLEQCNRQESIGFFENEDEINGLVLGDPSVLETAFAHGADITSRTYKWRYNHTKFPDLPNFYLEAFQPENVEELYARMAANSHQFTKSFRPAREDFFFLVHVRIKPVYFLYAGFGISNMYDLTAGNDLCIGACDPKMSSGYKGQTVDHLLFLLSYLEANKDTRVFIYQDDGRKRYLDNDALKADLRSRL